MMRKLMTNSGLLLAIAAIAFAGTGCDGDGESSGNQTQVATGTNPPPITPITQDEYFDPVLDGDGGILPEEQSTTPEASRKTASAPEPVTSVLSLLGLGALAHATRRRRRSL